MTSTDRTQRFPFLNTWVVWVVAYTIGVGVYAVHVSADFSVPDYVIAYALFGLLFLVQYFKVPVDDNIALHFETVFIIGFLLAYPISSVLWAVLGYGVALVIHRGWHRRWDNASKVMVNATNFATSAFIAHWTFSAVARSSVFSVTHILPILVASAIYLCSNTAIHGINILILERDSRAVGEFLKGITLRYTAISILQILIGLLVTVVITTAGLSGVILFTGLVVLVAYSYRDYFRMANHFKDLAIKDELTGLYNHRWVQSWIDDQIARQEPFALLMLDIDHFKRYNEVWGHLRGDEALRMVADIVRSDLKDDERVARYSGEEFFVVLPNCDLERASAKAEALRLAIDETEFPGSEKMPGKRFTVSLGVAAYPEMADNKKDLLMMVDDALYKGKFTGRNKVSIYSSVIDELKAEIALESAEHETINTIKVFLAILNSKDRYTYAHTERDARYVEALGKALGLTGDKLLYLRFGAFLHDIGKVEIPQEVLTKRGPLTRDEWVIMKSHVELGVKIIETIPSLQACIPIVLHHHERFDGTGYPANLCGYDIPLEARILTIADSFDAMTTSRPYQRKRSMEEAFEELRLCAGKQFDPDLVEPFITVVRDMGMLTNDRDEIDDLIAQT